MKRLRVLLLILLCTLLTGCTVTGETQRAATSAPSATATPAPTASSIPLSPEENERIDNAIDKLRDLDTLISLSIVQNDQYIRKELFADVQERYKNNVFSVTKSVTSMLVGIAIDEGYIDSVDQTIDEFLDIEDDGLNKFHQTIRIRDLLTMSSGLYWNNRDLGSEYHLLKGTRNTLEMILERETIFQPGEEFHYSDGSAHLMSIVFTRATGRSLHDYAKEKLFGPLDIQDTQWNGDRNGNSYGGFDLHLSNEDMVKIGRMVLNNGQVNGQQIIPAAWLETSTAHHIQTGSSATHNQHYGYYWWCGTVKGVDIITAVGHGGQFIYIVPELDLIITAACYGAVADSQSNRAFNMVRDTIVYKLIPRFVQ